MTIGGDMNDKPIKDNKAKNIQITLCVTTHEKMFRLYNGKSLYGVVECQFE